MVFNGFIPSGHIFILNQVPLIDDDYDALGGLLDIPGDVCILGRGYLGGVEHQEDDIGPVDGPQSPGDAVAFYPGLYPSPPPDSGRIDKKHALPLEVEHGIHGIPRGARRLIHDSAFFAHQGIEQH